METLTQGGDGQIGVAAGEGDSLAAKVRAYDAGNVGESRSPAGLAPAGMVSPDEAARLFGVNVSTWYVWESAGKVPPATWVALPRGGRAKFYPADAVERLRQTAGAAGAFPPPGTVDRHGAAAMFGVSQRTWSTWEKEGRVGDVGRMVSVLGKPGQHKVYPIAELERIKQHMDRLRRREPYEDPDRPGIWRVPIVSNKHERLEALIDAIDLPLAQGKRWNWSGGRAGGSGASVVVPGGGGALARLIMGVADDPEQLVCHVNGDRLDCRRKNLVVRTRSEVAKARGPRRKWEQDFEPYVDPDRPSVVRVPILTEKHKGMEALIDAADLPLVHGKRWHWSPGKPDPAKDGSVVLSVKGTPKPALSRTILGVEDPQQLVCHVNGNRLDCRRENLVVRTRAQVKAATRKVQVKGGRVCSSRFKGVHWQPDGRKWSASIASGGKIRQLGRFISELDAALAYDAAARELFGEHALLNFADPAEAQRLRVEQQPVEPGAFPPAGMVEVEGACQVFNIPMATWNAWTQQGRMPLSGERVSTPDGEDCTLYWVEDLNRLQDQIRELAKPYPDPDRPSCYRVPLISHVLYREAIVDEHSLPLVEGRAWHWQGRHDGTGLGWVALTAHDGSYTPLARVVADVAAAGRETRVSHRNGDRLDCRQSNLVVRSMQEQMFGNRKMGTVNGRQYTSNFKGVSWNKRGEKWLAVIQRDGRSRRLGSFHSEIAAAQAYDEAARELFGEHARLNFPDGVDSWLERAAACAKQRVAA